MITLGIETSCDETAAAVLRDSTILANSVYTQKQHSDYGGVVPEIASREHIKKIYPLTKKVLRDAGITDRELNLIAVADRPGLAGALLVGISFACGLHSGTGIPVTGVNHLEGHIASIFFADNPPDFPFLALIVSGGHTMLLEVENFGKYKLIGSTIDDAAGEAFDKVGKMIGFSYPAGRDIQQEAEKYTGSEEIDFPVSVSKKNRFDFSFSGLKTAVKYHIEKQPKDYLKSNRPLLCRSFQNAVIRAIISRINPAVKESGIHRVAVVGGVACNTELRRQLKREINGEMYFPPPKYTTDNGAMIALAGEKNHNLGNTRFPSMRPSGFLI